MPPLGSKREEGKVILVDGLLLAIEWKLLGREERPLVDWFTREEYERYLGEV